MKKIILIMLLSLNILPYFKDGNICIGFNLAKAQLSPYVSITNPIPGGIYNSSGVFTNTYWPTYSVSYVPGYAYEQDGSSSEYSLVDTDGDQASSPICSLFPGTATTTPPNSGNNELPQNETTYSPPPPPCYDCGDGGDGGDGGDDGDGGGDGGGGDGGGGGVPVGGGGVATGGSSGCTISLFTSPTVLSSASDIGGIGFGVQGVNGTCSVTCTATTQVFQGIISGGGSVFTNLSEGWYTLTATDQTNCVTTANACVGTAAYCGSTTPSFDIAAAVAHLDANFKSGKPGKPFQCAKYVRQAINAGGIATPNNPRSAYQYNPYLTTLGFVPLTNTFSGYTPQAGDIAVFPAIPGHPDGHIEMFDGTSWGSDYNQIPPYYSRGFWPDQGAQNNGTFEIFRWP